MTSPPPSSARANTIVVGVDGSSGAQRALDFALAEAALRGASVHAISSWDMAVAWGGETVTLFDEIESATREVLADAVARAINAAGATTPEVTSEVVSGQAAATLLAAAADALMLVVGSRGHGGFVGLLIGSVSQACATHAPCPVVVVPPTQEV